jgi:putative tricarboxylic transport membrane protein
MLVGLVGLDPITAQDRFTFGSFQLANGIDLVAIMIGLFVLSEVFMQFDSIDVQENVRGKDSARPEDSQLSWSEFRPCLPHVLRSSLIGAFIGVLPGVGSAVASFVAYGEGRRWARNPAEWGQGALEGVAAPEAANNAVSGPSMAPLLTLGIPGSTIGAILVGVFLIHGIQIGPTLYVTSRELIYSLFAAGLIGILCYGVFGYFGAAAIGRIILRLPKRILYLVVFLTSFVATFVNNGRLIDVWIMVGAGIVGWVMRKLDFSPAAFVIAFVLVGGAEEAFRQSLRLSDAGVMIFATRPIALAFLLLALVVLMVRVRQSYASARTKTQIRDA